MDKQQDTKQRILETTLTLIKSHASVSIKDITEAAFVNVAAVNYHFGGKDQLMALVINQVLQDFKQKLFKIIATLPKSQKTEETLAQMLDYLYDFAIENIGVLNYIFMNLNASKVTSGILMKEFLEDNDFTNLILSIMKNQSGIVDENILYARYMLIFSSFCVPLFMEIMSTINQTSKFSWRHNKQLKYDYIQELIRIIG